MLTRQRGTTSIAGEVKKIDELNKASESNDTEGEAASNLDTVELNVSQAQYYEQLQALKSSSGERVMDDVMARQISNDYILNKKTTRAPIPGVVDKSHNTTTGAVRYNLQRGQIVEIDETKPSRELVRLVGR